MYKKPIRLPIAATGLGMSANTIFAKDTDAPSTKRTRYAGPPDPQHTGQRGRSRYGPVGELFVLDSWIFQAKHASWGIGPAAMYLYKGVPKYLFGIVGYNLTSVAGDDNRADVNKFFFQPIWVSHFGWGNLGWTDKIATIDWEDDNALSFPVGPRFDRVFASSKKRGTRP